MEAVPRSVAASEEASAVVLEALAAEASVVAEPAEAGRTCTGFPPRTLDNDTQTCLLFLLQQLHKLQLH